MLSIFKFVFDSSVNQSTCFITPLAMWCNGVIILKMLALIHLIKPQKYCNILVLTPSYITGSFPSASKVGQPVAQA